MEDDILSRKSASDGDARAQCMPVQQQLIVVPAQSDTRRPIAHPDEVFNECRLLKIGALISEAQRLLRAGIKLVRVGDLISKALMKEGRIGIDAGFEFVAAVMQR